MQPQLFETVYTLTAPSLLCPAQTPPLNARTSSIWTPHQLLSQTSLRFFTYGTVSSRSPPHAGNGRSILPVAQAKPFEAVLSFSPSITAPIRSISTT